LTIDFDFQRYVERRKGARQAAAREGAAYAYTGDLKVRRTLAQLRPVGLALAATERLWRATAQSELLDRAVRASPEANATVYAVAQRAAHTLHLPAPPIYIATDQRGMNAHTLGTDEQAYVLLDGGLVDALNEAELADVLGRQLAAIQNQHVLYTTALYYLERFAARFVRWIVAPALLALHGWAKRAAITGDRGGLICTRDLEVSTATLGKIGATAERIAALRLFASSAFFLGLAGREDGISAAACDAQVAELLS
jgi:Zn-dependent protease with chaperone function